MQISASLRSASRADSRAVRVAQRKSVSTSPTPTKKTKNKNRKKKQKSNRDRRGREEEVSAVSDNGGLGYTLSIRQTFHHSREDCLLCDYCDMVITNHGICLKRLFPIVITKKRTAGNMTYESIKSLYKLITSFYESSLRL